MKHFSIHLVPQRLQSAMFLLILCLGPALASVSCTPPPDQLEGNLDYSRLPSQVEMENRQAEHLREREIERLEQAGPAPLPPLEPIIPAYNPLDETLVSISMRNQPLHDILFLVARNAGLNLVIEPGISLDNTVTISFESAKSSVVVETLLKAYDLSYSIKDNVLYVERFMTKKFDLGFLNSKTVMDLENGGDIFGTVGTSEGVGDLTGSIGVSSSLGRGNEEGSLYEMLSRNVAAIINETSDASTSSLDTDSGSFSLDPVAGTLMVKTTPARMEGVARLVRNLQSKLVRQVVIDARILEVSLSDDFRFGIDWNYVTERLIDNTLLGISLGWSGIGSAPALTVPSSANSGNMSLNSPGSALSATIDILQTFGGVKVVANPHVRARHGQPALFTSGSSFRYVSEISRETSDTGSITYTVETSSVFDGIMLGVLPYINDDLSVDLQIFPIQSQVNTASLELVDVTGAGDRISLPQTDIKNVSTSVRVNDGDIVILGGLIDKNLNKDDAQVPGAGSVPILGWLFRQQERTELVRELVIIMHIRVIQ